MPSSCESKSYIRFLEETGVEHVASIFRWIYVRKKVSDGALDLYSDIGSKIRYMKRLRAFFISMTQPSVIRRSFVSCSGNIRSGSNLSAS
ncbi:MAG: DUF2812 domain-containing protein [Eubacteriales bacterium]|nr:DUF2812 domain-containing protein [Eubacteriales bacterium]